MSQLSARGWHLVTEAQYDVRYWVKDVPSLVFWFKAIAGANEVPADFSIATHHDVVNTLIQQFGSERGLATNEHRTLVIARKSELRWVEAGCPKSTAIRQSSLVNVFHQR